MVSVWKRGAHGATGYREHVLGLSEVIVGVLCNWEYGQGLHEVFRSRAWTVTA